jgi:predicted DsbA family dithiol-disulfide isomerase
MSDLTEENAVCGIDGCGPAADATATRLKTPTSTKRHQITIVSDVICPWCYIAKKHLEQAFALTSSAGRFAVTWRPYELNPNIPKEGMDRRAYRSRKFGSWEQSRQLDAQVASAAKSAGLEFRHDLMLRTPNTFKAHRLIWFAEHQGVQDAFVEAIFKAYFTQGRDVGDIATLIDIATEAGVDRPTASAFLHSEAGTAEVKQEEGIALQNRIDGVPTFILDGEQIFSGAQKPDVIALYLSAAMDAHLDEALKSLT